LSSYHKDNGEGADFYSVGKSLGCGGSALLQNNNLFQSGVYSTYKIIENGPIRLSFELEYNFVVNGEPVYEQKIITLDAGSNLNKVQTTYMNRPDNATFTAGLVIRENITETINEDNSIISLWGPITDKSENGNLGIAIVNKKDVNIFKNENETPHILIHDENRRKSYTYYSGAAWDKSRHFSSKKNGSFIWKDINKD
jgi:hypothetical protein